MALKNKKILLALYLLSFIACTPEDSNTNSQVASQVADQAKRFGPNDTKADLLAREVPHVTIGDATIFVGYQQVSNNNQDPIVMRFDGDDRTYARTDYETSGDDGKAYGLLWDGGDVLYVAFSVTGTQGSASEDFRRFANGGWFSSYGRGGGPKAAVLAKLDPDSGEGLKATYLRSQLSNGNSNSFVIKGLDYADETVTVQANAWFSPPSLDGTPMSCQGSSPFDYTVKLNSDLSQATAVTASGCQ